MDVIFDCENGESFRINVDYCDTFLEVKQKIFQYDSRIPVSYQLLSYEGERLNDNDNVLDHVFGNSRIKLELINMDVIFNRQDGVSFNMDVGFYDTFLEVKEKVYNYHNIPASMQLLYFQGVLLEDHVRAIDIKLWKKLRIKVNYR